MLTTQCGAWPHVRNGSGPGYGRGSSGRISPRETLRTQDDFHVTDLHGARRDLGVCGQCSKRRTAAASKALGKAGGAAGSLISSLANQGALGSVPELGPYP